MNTIKIGIIGTGVGIRTHTPAFRRIQGVEVYAISGSSRERAAKFASEQGIPYAFGDYKELIDMPEIDLVCITSPNKFHFEQAMYAIKCGKHLLCEKPLAMSLEEADKLVKNAKNSTKINIINHQLRFNPYIQKVKQIIKEGLIGRPYFARVHQQSTAFSNREMDWIWSFDENEGGGVRLAMASHLIDLISFWFEKKCFNVKGTMDLVVPERKVKEVTACSFFSSTLSLDNNLEVQLSATAASCGEARFDFSIYGTEGELHFNLENKLSGAFLNDRGVVVEIEVDGVTDLERQNKVSIFSGSFDYFAPIIIDAIKNNDNTLLVQAAHFEDGLQTQIILDAIKGSAISGGAVKINEGYIAGAKY